MKMISKAIVAAAAALLLLLPATAQAEEQKDARHVLVPAVYVFGDSLVDVGNNNYLPDGSGFKATNPHYGIDYPGRKPTGRFSNGYLAADFLSQKLGFQESPPAVLSVDSLARQTRGLNFASSGSGILDTTRPNSSLPMNVQIAYFRRAARLLSAAEGAEAARRRLAGSLFLVATGVTDLVVNIRELRQQNALHTERFMSFIAAQLGSQLRTLYRLGARKFAVADVPPVGCQPLLRAMHPEGACNDFLNTLAAEFNTALKRELSSIATSSDYKGFRYSYLNRHDMVLAMFNDPARFGFKEIFKACCGSGPFNGATPCLPNATPCDNRDEYLIWDWTNPTQATYKIIAEWAYDGEAPFVHPVNVHDLVIPEEIMPSAEVISIDNSK